MSTEEENENFGRPRSLNKRLENLLRVQEILSERLTADPGLDHIERGRFLREALSGLAHEERAFLFQHGRTEIINHPAFAMEFRTGLHRASMAGMGASDPDYATGRPWATAPFVLRLGTRGQVLGTRMPTDPDATSIMVHVHHPGSPLTPSEAYWELENTVYDNRKPQGAAGVLVVVPSVNFNANEPLEDLFMALALETPEKQVVVGGSPQIQATLVDILKERINPERSRHRIPAVGYFDVLTHLAEDPRLTRLRSNVRITGAAALHPKFSGPLSEQKSTRGGRHTPGLN